MLKYPRISLVLWATLFLWLLGIGYIDLAHGDLFLVGRTKGFSLCLNGTFGAVTVSCLYLVRREGRPGKLMVRLGILVWVFSACCLGFPSVFLGFFGKPSDQSIVELAIQNGIDEGNTVKILGGPPLSATTEYQRDVYRWRVYFELLMSRE